LYSPEKGFGIQLHGDEPPDFVRALRMEGLGQTGDLFQILGHVPTIPVIRAFRCAGPTLEPQAAYLKQCQHLGALPQVVMLDACSPGSYGGTGECVDWQAVGREKSKLLGLPVILAGGLTPANVADAIKTAQPAGVDVASGVESAPGKKDAAKVMAFAAFAKQAFAAIDG